MAALRPIRSIPEASLSFRVWDLPEVPQDLAAGVDREGAPEVQSIPQPSYSVSQLPPDKPRGSQETNNGSEESQVCLRW